MKKNKLLGIAAACLFAPTCMQAQDTEMQTGDTTYYKSLIPEEKQGLLKNMSMIANMHFSERNEFTDGNYTGSKFVNENFRLEIKGQVTDKVYFRFRDRYTRAQTSESLDKLSRSTDMAYVRVDVTEKFNISAGKMCASWGGIEFDMNPIDIYEYSDIVEQADNFLSGVRLNYKVNDKHSFTVEGLDSRTKTFDELYGAQPTMTVSKVPMAFVANWTGSMFDGHLNTIWAYAFHNEAKNTAMHYIALGNQLFLGKFGLAYDFQYSDEDLDRTTIVSSLVPDSLYAYSVKNTLYMGHWVRLNYRFSKKINVAFVGCMNIADWKSDVDILKNTDRISNSLQYIPSVEFYPFDNANLKFYINYVGRTTTYSDYAKSRLGAKDFTSGRVCIGLVSPLGIF